VNKHVTHDYLTLRGAVNTGNHVDECRFAAARFPDNADKLAFTYRQVDVLESQELTGFGFKGLNNILHLDEIRLLLIRGFFTARLPGQTTHY